MNNVFQPASFFMLRAPLISIDSFYGYLSSHEDILVYIRKQPFYDLFKEALLVSSQTLYEALLSYERELLVPRKIELLRSSILKYYLRATTRPTPFGYFSGIKVGYLGDHTNFNIQRSTCFRK